MAASHDAKTQGGGPGIPLAVASACVALVLLALAMRDLPETICDPKVSLPVLAFAAAQAAFVLALGAFRRAGLPRLFAGTLPLAWALASAAVLALREAAGDVEAIGRGDAFMAVATALGLFLMLHGMGLRLETSGQAAWAVVPVLALGLSFAWLRVVEDGTSQRTWRSWNALTDFADALASAQKAGGVPRGDATLDEVIAQLVPTHARALPRVDGWGHELEYVSDGKTWELSSLGAFGEIGPTSRGPVRGHADDLVVSDEGVLAWPESPCGSLDETQVQELRAPEPATAEPALPPAPAGAVDKRNEPRRR